MNIVRQRRLLWAIALMCVTSSVVVLAAALLVSIEVDRTPKVASERLVTEVAESVHGRVPDLHDFEVLFGRRFRRPLYDPPPPEEPPPPEKPKVPPPNLRLLVTMIEAGGNQAMFLDPNGVTLMKGIGESVTDQRVSAEIVEILADHVVLRHDDRLFKLQLNQ